MVLEQSCFALMQILQLEFIGRTQNMIIGIHLGLSLQLLRRKLMRMEN